MHSLLADYNVTAVDYLAGFLAESPDDPALIGLLHDGTQYLGYRMSGEYYSFGNYTRYVRPGAVRVAASSDLTDVRVSAFVLNGRLTFVAINENSNDVVTRFELGQLSGGTTFGVARTSEHEHLVALPSVATSSGSLAVVLKGNSITTLYQ